MSAEYAIAAKAFELSNQDLWKLVSRSVDYTFLPRSKRELLRNYIACCMNDESA